MSSKRFELFTAPEHENAPKIIDSAISHIANHLEDLSVRNSLKSLTAKEFDQHGDATISIAVLEVAEKIAVEDSGHLYKTEEALGVGGFEVKKSLDDDARRFFALKEMLVRRHTVLSRFSVPFQVEAGEGDRTLLTDNEEFLRERHLKQWLKEYRDEIIPQQIIDAEKIEDKEEKARVINLFKTEEGLINLYLNQEERLQKRHYEELIETFEDKVTFFVDQLGLVLLEYLKSPSPEMSQKLLTIEEEIEKIRQFIAMLEGRKAEKAALKK